MTTMTTLDDVREAMVRRGHAPQQVDELIDLAGRMVLESSFATKDDLARFRDDFTAFKFDTIERFAEQRTEFNQLIGELRTEMLARFAEQDAKMQTQFAEQDAKMQTQFAELHAQFNQLIGELRVEMESRFAQQESKLQIAVADLRAEMRAAFAEQEAKMQARFDEQEYKMETRFAQQEARDAVREARMTKWVFGAVFAGVVLNTGITSLLLVVLPRLLE